MKLIRFIIATLFATALVFGDGLLLSKNDDYPGELLRNRVTEVTVKIEGLIAETVVYQEFVNEANFSVDAVYSFPLPADARSTMLLYTRNDTTFEAVLEVRQQATNPGTGDDGIAALINAYIGRNGLKWNSKTSLPAPFKSLNCATSAYWNIIRANAAMSIHWIQEILSLIHWITSK
jgi:hypothetical protein